MDQAIKKTMNKLIKMDRPRDKAFKKVKKHLKEDIKGYKKEAKEDRELLKKIKFKK